MKPTAYAYEASLHCPEHAAQRFNDLETAIDNEGNPVSAVYSWDIQPDTYCDECLYECITNNWPGRYASFA